MLTINNAILFLTINNTDYTIEGKNTVSFEDPLRNVIIRGEDGLDKEGLVGTQGKSEATTITINVTNISKDLASLLTKCFYDLNNKGIRSRIGFLLTSFDGTVSYKMSNCEIESKPIQNEIGSIDTVSINIVLIGFDLEPSFK